MGVPSLQGTTGADIGQGRGSTPAATGFGSGRSHTPRGIAVVGVALLVGREQRQSVVPMPPAWTASTSPRSACTVSPSALRYSLTMVSARRRPERVSLARSATLQPTTYRLKTSMITYRWNYCPFMVSLISVMPQRQSWQPPVAISSGRS